MSRWRRCRGLATRTAFELPQRVLWDQLDDFVLVSEEELRRAVLQMLESTRNLVEPAGAASLVAAFNSDTGSPASVSPLC